MNFPDSLSCRLLKKKIMDLDKKIRRLSVLFGIGLFIFSWVAYSIFSVPAQFGKNRLISVKQGDGLSEIADSLDKEEIIKSAFVFKFLVFVFFGQKDVKAGDYFFDEPLSVFGVVSRITDGIYGLSSTRVRILEGWTAWQIGGHFEELGFFSRKNWMALAENKEGYLFPDTYFFLPNTLPEKIIETMRENFDKKISDFESDIKKSKRSLEDLIIMASLIEKESASSEDARIISGILWKRLDAGMGLQVDAALTYITGKPSSELTEKDLAMDSSYNTYKYRGLPPTPIGNPGLEAIKAAIFPEKTLYWFYLHGRDGKPHYAITFEEHVANKQRYLR